MSWFERSFIASRGICKGKPGQKHMSIEAEQGIGLNGAGAALVTAHRS